MVINTRFYSSLYSSLVDKRIAYAFSMINYPKYLGSLF